MTRLRGENQWAYHFKPETHRYGAFGIYPTFMGADYLDRPPVLVLPDVWQLYQVNTWRAETRRFSGDTYTRGTKKTGMTVDVRIRAGNDPMPAQYHTPPSPDAPTLSIYHILIQQFPPL